MSRQLNVGFVGLGYRARELVQCFLKYGPGIRIVAGADPNASVFTLFEKAVGTQISCYTDYKRMLRHPNLDVIVVATPDHLHREHTVLALDAGKHVYLEKPMAITSTDAHAILDAACGSDGLLYVGHNLRQTMFLKTMKEIIASGAIGEVKSVWCRHFISYGGDAYFKNWHAEQRFVNSLLLQKGVHDIDAIHWLAGSYSECVSAFGDISVYGRGDENSVQSYDPNVDTNFRTEHWPPKSLKNLNPRRNIEDNIIMNLRLQNGALCTYMQNHFSPDAWRNYTVIGTKGRIENFGDMKSHAKIYVWTTRHNTYGDPTSTVDLPLIDEGRFHGHADYGSVAECLDQILLHRTPPITMYDAYNAVLAADAGTQSMRTNGSPQKIDPITQGPW
jgi:predicted dehydrogenase